MADMMASGNGMSPRKAMAMGDSAGGGFGVKGYPGSTKPHPDRGMDTGVKMADADRGVGHPVSHSPDMHPAQAAPRHGPMFEKSMGHMRDGKV